MLVDSGGSMLTRDEILAIYAAGPEAVVSVIEQLQKELLALSARVQALEDRLRKDSHNSHKPPSSDGLARGAPKSLRGKSGKAPGAQPGHPGQTLRPVEEADEFRLHAPPACAHCGTSLEAVAPWATERRQVFDLPKLALHVTEHQAQTKCCPCCGQSTKAAFPAGVSQTAQYGAGILALSVYLQTYQLLPYARSAELLRDLFGRAPSEGTLAAALEQAYTRLAPVEQEIRAAIHRASVVHFDETGIRVQARLHWLHTASTQRLTFYAAHPKRGRKAIDALGVLPEMAGTRVHDAYTSYLSYDGAYALCNAHLLRDLIGLEERSPQAWIQGMLALLRQMKQQVERASEAGASALEGAQLAALEACYDALLAQGRSDNPVLPRTGKIGRRKQTPAQNLLDRLDRHRDAVLAFVHDFAVPFDNNLAERDLRMAKVQQKISGGFRTAHGAALFCRIRGYISTLRKQKSSVLTALRSLFTESPFMPQLQS
ncbi:MAG TPA: IS66 family transposase [Longimicrobiaceae bacterium]|nr:IS66 family transposase [Longimicrobiaceae bacterium]